MKDFDIKYIQLEQFCSLMCPSCKVNLRPHYHNGAKSPSYYYCQDRSAPYANTPHYKYFNEDGYGYEAFLIWNNPTRGDLFTVKRTIEDDKIIKVELTYSIRENGDRGVKKPITRIFSPEDFDFDSSDIETLEKKVTSMVEIAEIFL